MTSLQSLINPTADIFELDAYSLDSRQLRDLDTFQSAAQFPWVLRQMKADSIRFWRLELATDSSVQFDGLVLAEVCRRALAFERGEVR